jgi:hypothetical protein
MDESTESFFGAFEKLDECIRLQDVILLPEVDAVPALDDNQREKDALSQLKTLVRFLDPVMTATKG